MESETQAESEIACGRARALQSAERMGSRTQELVWEAYAHGEFDPDSFISYFNRHGKLTEGQIKYVNDVYGRFMALKSTGERFLREKGKEYFSFIEEVLEKAQQVRDKSSSIGPLKGKITQLEKGVCFNRNFLSKTIERCLESVPEDKSRPLKERREGLQEDYWTIYDEERRRVLEDSET